ncbi:MAG: NitT/TauT family transport system ATP-binding protein [Clostridiales bacterium]|jgi:NitT/TauT family transport system ATP-binding protein|nr:NitT/TauT family transport system ATP-binding protein [Clostridiales bacterium]MDN5299945.1 NitT/TauT family transport system ATP-binding protein [Clostridiales bacterium]
MLKISGLGKAFDHRSVLEGVDLTISKREIVSIIGPSGSGKTTLLKLIAGLLTADTGMIERSYTRLSYVFQEDRLLPWLTVAENVKLVNDSLTEEACTALLAMMRLADSQLLFPSEISGGMRQRVAMARAFAYEPELILLDEPFKSIDQFLRKQLIEDMLTLWRVQGQSVLLVTHDPDEAIAMSDTIYLMDGAPADIVKRIVIETPRNLTETAKQTIRNEIEKFWEERTS